MTAPSRNGPGPGRPMDRKADRAGLGRQGASALLLALLVSLPLLVYGNVGSQFPGANHTTDVQGSPPNLLTPGPMGETDLNADQTGGTANASKQYLWKEIPLPICLAGSNPPSGCTNAPNTGNFRTIDHALVRVDTSLFDGNPMFFLEASLHSTGVPGESVQVQLNRLGTGSVTGSTITSTSATRETVRSSGFTLTGLADYVPETVRTGGVALVFDVRLIVRQDAPTVTQTHVVLSEADSSSNTNNIDPDRATRVLWEPQLFDGKAVSVTFVAVAQLSTGSLTGTVTLVNATDNSVVTTLNFPSGSNSPRRVASGDIAGGLDAGTEYKVRFQRGIGVGTMNFHHAMLVISQSDFDHTVRYVHLAHTDTTSSSTLAAPTSSPFIGRYHMDSEWGNLTAWFEFTATQSATPSTITAQLYNVTGASAVAGSTIDHDAPTLARTRTASAFTLSPHNSTYEVRWNVTSGSATLRGAFLIVEQFRAKTYDHVLTVPTSINCTSAWAYDAALVSGSGVDMTWLQVMRLDLENATSAQTQVAFDQGNVTVSAGDPVNVTAGQDLELTLYVQPNASKDPAGRLPRFDIDVHGECDGVHLYHRLRIQAKID